MVNIHSGYKVQTLSQFLMRIAQAAFSSVVINPFTWRGDWAWGLPLIVLTVVIHVSGLGLISQRAVHVAGRIIERRHPRVALVVVMGAMTLEPETTIGCVKKLVWNTWPEGPCAHVINSE